MPVGQPRPTVSGNFCCGVNNVVEKPYELVYNVNNAVDTTLYKAEQSVYDLPCFQLNHVPRIAKRFSYLLAQILEHSAYRRNDSVVKPLIGYVPR